MIELVFSPKNLREYDGSFCFEGAISTTAHHTLNSEIMKEFWHGCSYSLSSISFDETDETIFKIGSCTEPELCGEDYAVTVCKDGVFVKGKDSRALKEGFLTLIDRILPDGKDKLKIGCCEFRETADIKNRMVHYCIFPETELWELEKLVRFACILKFSHIVLEFWGMYKLECLKELSWNHAYTKDDLKAILKIAKDSGVEIIPMFNHWGHASACRAMHGKHVVLDQNPALAYLFSEDGWSWKLGEEAVTALHDKIRAELIDLCGEGEYFHIGCDEAYGFDFSKESMDAFITHITHISESLEKVGRRAIMWADMLIFKDKTWNEKNNYYAFCKSEECEEYLLSRLPKNIVIADWQYEAPKAPVETVKKLSSRGFDVVLCPWNGVPHIGAAAQTVKEFKLFGIMQTTWHTLSCATDFILRCARSSVNDDDMSHDMQRIKGAEAMRKAYFANGNYERSGWSKKEIGIIT